MCQLVHPLHPTHTEYLYRTLYAQMRHEHCLFGQNRKTDDQMQRAISPPLSVGHSLVAWGGTLFQYICSKRFNYKKKTANSPAHTCASAYMQQPGWKCKEGQGCRLMGEWQQWITVVADRLTTHSVHNFETSSNGKFQENPMIWASASCGIMALRLCMPWLVV